MYGLGDRHFDIIAPRQLDDCLGRWHALGDGFHIRQDVIERMQSYGYVADSSTPQQLFEINREDLVLWRKLIADVGMALD